MGSAIPDVVIFNDTPYHHRRPLEVKWDKDIVPDLTHADVQKLSDPARLDRRVTNLTYDRYQNCYITEAESQTVDGSLTVDNKDQADNIKLWEITWMLGLGLSIAVALVGIVGVIGLLMVTVGGFVFAPWLVTLFGVAIALGLIGIVPGIIATFKAETNASQWRHSQSAGERIARFRTQYVWNLYNQIRTNQPLNLDDRTFYQDINQFFTNPNHQQIQLREPTPDPSRRVKPRVIRDFPIYANLPTLERELTLEDDTLCSITFDDPEQPIFYAGRIYDYKAFITWYKKNPTDPFTRELINFDHVRGVDRVKMQHHIEAQKAADSLPQPKAEPAYDSLPEVERELGPEDECALCFEIPIQPILLDGLIYDYESFMKWFQEKGVHPVTLGPVDFSQMKRIVQPS